jgi:CDP-2,3-bis-(O-geranylgeranyl)-sn-glycerol synthase
MLNHVLLALWFFLPAGIANLVPVFAAKIPGLSKLDAPIDGGKNFRGRRIFGAHKTWRGMIAGIIAGTLTLWLQQHLFIESSWIRSFASDIDYPNLPTLIVGPLFAIGALGGDAIESFFKRQRNIAPGKGWFPFDQTDYIIGGAIATMPFIQLSLLHYALLLVIWLVIHVISTVIGWMLGLKDAPI